MPAIATISATPTSLPARASCRPKRRCVAACSAEGGHQGVQPAREASRRGVLLGSAAALLAAPLLAAGPARAGIVQDYLRSTNRPDVGDVDAVVQLLDARGVLYEIKALAATPQDSQERRASNSLIPGYAKRLRAVGNAAPAVAALATGTDKEKQVSEQYGGQAGDSASLTDPIYITVGQVLNYSGRGLREEALANPEFAALAIAAIEDLVKLVPESYLSTAQAQREAARAAQRE